MAGRQDIIAKQSIPQHLRYSFEDFLRQFPNDDACLEHIKEQRWPRGITYCEKCKADKKHHRVTDRTAYACETCGLAHLSVGRNNPGKNHYQPADVVLRHVPDGFDPLRNLRKADPA